MEEIKIEISVIEAEMQSIENKVDDFSRHGRSPNKQDRFQQINLLNEWRDYNNKLSALREVAEAIENNVKNYVHPF